MSIREQNPPVVEFARPRSKVVEFWIVLAALGPDRFVSGDFDPVK